MPTQSLPTASFLHPARWVPLNLSRILFNTLPKVDRLACPKQALPLPRSPPSTLQPQGPCTCCSRAGWYSLFSGLCSNFSFATRPFLTTHHKTVPGTLTQYYSTPFLMCTNIQYSFHADAQYLLLPLRRRLHEADACVAQAATSNVQNGAGIWCLKQLRTPVNVGPLMH